MAMVIAWHTLKQARQSSGRPRFLFLSDAFLIVTPGHHDPGPAARAAAE